MSHKFIIKNVTSMLVIFFSAAAIAWPLPDMYLRPLAAADRGWDVSIKYSIHNLRGQKLVYLVDIPDEGRYPGKRPVALLFHGLAGRKNQPHITSYAERFVQDGYVVIRPDFTNNKKADETGNESDGYLPRYSLEGKIDDVSAVLAHVRQEIDEKLNFDEVVLSGHSYGALIARNIAARACSGYDANFSSITIQGVIDLSGIICPRYSLLKVLKRLEKDSKIANAETGYEKWKESDCSDYFNKQRFYLIDRNPITGEITHDWENYLATQDLERISPEVIYIYLIGAEDENLMCTGTEGEQQVQEFLRKIQIRPNGALIRVPGIAHNYPEEALSSIVEQTMVSFRLLRARNFRSSIKNDVKLTQVLGGMI